MSLCREQAPCKDASPLVPVHSTQLHAGAGRPPVVQRVGHPWGTGAGWVAYRAAPGHVSAGVPWGRDTPVRGKEV